MPIEFDNDAVELEEERMVTSRVLSGEDDNENKLRPQKLQDYFGQEKIQDMLSVFIDAAKFRSEPLDHTLLYGPPGLGKTTLAAIIANEMGVNIRTTTGPAIEKPRDLAAILTNLNENDILFIDEIHRLNRTVEEVLYPAMEDFMLDIIVGQGPAARTIRIDLKKFTLIGATTRAGQLSSPLRDRFGVQFKLELYSDDELEQIVRRSAGILNIPVKDPKPGEVSGTYEIARRSRGTPRIANRLLKRVRDYAQVRASGVIDKDITDIALNALDIDKLGLDAVDRRMLKSIITSFGGGPVGLETLAYTIGEEAITIEDVYEPYLMQLGFLNRTPRGRCATPAAYRHLGLPVPKSIDMEDNGQMTFSDQ